ncbi:MAG: orotidine-5'-phosphate decarboxylase [Ignavibacteriae bacterium]|nr:orotidine-5'-phosphate decarboxylase [Ignavibacteriota bacterium]
MHFLEKLDGITSKNKSLVCVGLDTDPAKIPAQLGADPDGVIAFNRAIIEATADVAQSYKLNLAFYEALGARAHEVLRRTLDAIPPGLVTIGDGKRGDIGNTSAMYASALFDDLGFDAVTVAPYMGRDSVQPFLAHADKGVFILALTSNAGSKDFQYLQVDGAPLYRRVIDTILTWNEHGNCGLVVGATHPSELADIRAHVGELPILVPGLGAQGGDVELSVKAGVTPAGLRAVFNSSRGILYASKGDDFAARAREAAIAMRDEINGHLPAASR